MSIDRMAADHHAAYKDKHAIDTLANTIRAALNDPPARLSNQSRNALIVALSRLEADAARIVRLFD